MWFVLLYFDSFFFFRCELSSSMKIILNVSGQMLQCKSSSQDYRDVI